MTVQTPNRQRHGNARMMYLVDQYKRAHPDEGDEVFPHLIADWAYEQGLWQRPKMDPREVLRRLVSRALRNEYIEDSQGRGVRKFHATVEEIQTSDGTQKRTKWLDIHEAPADHMRLALSLRRRAALADVVQLELDFEYWNENNRFGEKLPPMDYDFNADVEELKQPVDYPDSAPEENEDEEEEIL